jgi:ribose-phosphate pyrophosphokinase
MLYVDDIKVEVKNFPNGETYMPIDQAALSEIGPSATLRLKYESDADLVHLDMLHDHIAKFHPECVMDLRVDYLPYSRMDRQTDYVFSLPTITKRINSLSFAAVTVQEPHSDVCMALLERSWAAYPSATWLLQAALEAVDFDASRDFLFFPDAGAQKRYAVLAGKYQHLVGFKHRGDLGGLSEYQVLGAEGLKDQSKIVIVDDLCSRGGTFVLASEALREFGREYAGIDREIYLVVTHLENSVYQGKLLEANREQPDGTYHCAVQGVFASTSMQEESQHELVHLYDIASRALTANGGTKNAYI